MTTGLKLSMLNASPLLPSASALAPSARRPLLFFRRPGAPISAPLSLPSGGGSLLPSPVALSLCKRRCGQWAEPEPRKLALDGAHARRCDPRCKHGAACSFLRPCMLSCVFQCHRQSVLSCQAATTQAAFVYQCQAYKLKGVLGCHG